MDLKPYREIRIDSHVSIPTPSLPKNPLSLCPYSPFSILLTPLINLYIQPTFIFFLLQAFLEIQFQNSYIILALLLFITSLFYISELKFAVPLLLKARFFNQQIVDLWNGTGFVKVQSKELMAGQIVKITGRVPADLLILASDCESIAVKSYMECVEEKEAPKGLKAIVYYEDLGFVGLGRLFGTAEVEETNVNFGEFEGKIKIRGKPNSIKVGLSNVLYQGSKVEGTVLGLVVYTGTDTKFMKTLRNRFRNSLINNKINKKSWMLFVPFLLFVLFSTVPAYLLLPEFGVLSSIVYYFLLYGNFIPISLFVVLDLLRGIHYLFLKPVLKGVTIAGLQKIENCGNTEYVLCDENTLIDFPTVSRFVNGENIEFLDDDGTLITDRSLNMTFAKQDLSSDLWSLIVLSTSVEKRREKLFGPKHEVAIIKAAEKLGMRVKIKNQKEVVLKTIGKKVKYEVLAISKLEHRTRVLVSKEGIGYFLVQGESLAVSSLLPEPSNYTAEEYSSEFYTSGLMPYTFVYKKLSSSKFLKISERIREFADSKTDSEKKLKRLMNKQEKKLIFLTTVGIECPVRSENLKSVQDLLGMGVKVCVLSAGNRFKAEVVSRSLGFYSVINLIGLESEASCYRILRRMIMKKLYKENTKRDESRVETLKDFEEGPKVKNSRYSISEKLIVNHRIFRKVAIKNNLDCLEHDYDWKKKVFLIIDRGSLLMCVKNKVTLKMIVSLIAASEGFYAFGLYPEDKLLLVNLIQNHIKHKPGVFAYCADFWSLGMAQAAYTSGSLSPKLYLDFKHLKFSFLPKLLSQTKQNWQISEFSVFWNLYTNWFQILIQFLFQFFQQFSAASIWIGNIGVFLKLITSVQLLFRTPGKIKFFQYFSAGIIQIALVTIFLFHTGVLEGGKVEDFEVFSQVLFVCVAFGIIFQCYWENRSVFGGLCACGLLILVSALTRELQPYGSGFFWIVTCFSGFVFALPGVFFSCFFPSSKRVYKNLASVYRDSDLCANEKDSLSRKKYSLQFRSKRSETEFRRFYIKETLSVIKFTFAALFCILLIWALTTIFVNKESGSVLINRIYITSAFLLFFAFSFTSYFLENSSLCITFILLVSVVAKFVIEFSTAGLSIISTILLPPTSFILLNTNWLVVCYINTAAYILNTITLSVYLSTIPILKFYSIVLLTLLFTVSAVVGYEIEKYHRDIFILTKQIQMQVENTQSVLEILLPEFVISRVKAGVRYIAEDRGEVTVIFCDICDFEQLCSDYSPKEFCSLLDSIFSVFDSLCEDFGATKIETVGKTYMACCGLNKSVENETPARVACDLALAMISEASKIKLKTGNLHVKIGINTGPVTAGVVGFHKPQFSLVGDTVNTASRMCSTLQSGNSIQISNSTFAAVQDFSGISLTPNSIFAKGKGRLETFLIAKDKNSEGSQYKRKLSGLVSHRVSDWRQSVMSREDTELIPSIWRVKSVHTSRQKLYLEQKIESRAGRVKFLLGLSSFCYLLLVISVATESLNSSFIIAELILKLIVFIASGLLFVFHKRHYAKQVFSYLTILLYLTAYISSVLSINSNTEDTFILEISTTLLLINYTQHLSLTPTLILNLFLVLFYILSLYLLSSLSAQSSLLVAFIGLLNCFAFHKIESKFQKSFNLKIQSDKEIRDTENLLVQMMPANVVYRLSEGSSVTDKLHDVTILFADIVGFTAWSAGKSPLEVVQMLSNLFTEFDKKCVELGVYKVHTIGDCYVIIGYLAGTRDPYKECWNVYSMAKNMIKIIEEENQAYQTQLAMRIGIHSGNLVAGVIGTGVVRYDIWGKDVMIANKMESHGQSGRVCVSEECKRMLEEGLGTSLKFEFNQDVDGTGCYFVCEGDS